MATFSGEARKAVRRALGRHFPFATEDELEGAADAIMFDLSHTTAATYIRKSLGTCPFRFVSIFAALGGAEWSRILGFAYDLASGPDCECQYCKEKRR